MAEIVIMPKQGLQMSEGVITRWLAFEGEEVKKGQPLFEMETDKLTITIDAASGGTLLKILHVAGETVPITQPIAIIGEASEDISQLLLSDQTGEATAQTQAAAPAADTHTAETDRYDVAVLGAGPGGYEAALRCAQYGLRAALIEARELGGTCLNRGCIPTKALLHGAMLYQQTKDAAQYGVLTEKIAFDYAKMAAHKDAVVNQLRRGVAALEKAHGVTVLEGFGVLQDAHTIAVGEKIIRADSIILATGAQPAKPPIAGMDHENVLTSDEVLSLTQCPKSLAIIGGGVIGIEFATLFSALGCEVTVLEMMPSILPGVDADIVSMLTSKLQRQGVRIVPSARVTGISQSDGNMDVSFELNGVQQTVSAQYCVVSTGRKPQTQGIGLEAAGVATQRGFVTVDACMRTNIDNIYAVGDITGKLQLAHTATAQGLVAAANCAGKQQTMRYDAIPACIYTSPEIAYVGLNEAQTAGCDVCVGRFNVGTNGKAMVMGEKEGVVKLISDAHTGEILGAQLYAPRATDMIGEICAVMMCEGTIEELSATIHPHPTVSEVIMEAAHDTHGLCCHALPKR